MPGGFGEQGNVIIDFKGTRDILEQAISLPLKGTLKKRTRNNGIY